MTSTTAATSRGLRGGAAIAVAMGIMNIATYGYTVAAAHLIGRVPFGAFSALMGVLLVVSVVSLGLQATGARRISADPDQVESIERNVLEVAYRVAVVLGLLLLALAPVLNWVLQLESLATATLVAVAAVPLTVMGGQAGVLQGERRWEPLALVYLSQGLGRVVLGTGFMVVWQSEFAAMLGVALGCWVPAVVGYVALRRPRAVNDTPVEGHPRTDILREVAGSSQALLAFFALSNADILLARAVLDADVAGLYAGGLILVKAILFLPQFVVVIAFPAMSTKDAGRSTLVKALAVSAALGACGFAATLTLPDLALVFVGGDDFAGIKDKLWLFAIVGTLLSMVQLLLYSALARRQGRAVLMIWTTLVALLAGSFTVHSVTSLVTLVCIVDTALLVGLVITAWRAQPASPATEVARTPEPSEADATQ
ncbi:oligosaccharide flippase family protein [Nocardioides psychrotolerans]|uniref:lipopolysaccharide biosynthesis protein n=1 Tax=Nocardioides psychrotolerans TaxID=1005945 RepID=UPI00313785EC